MVISTPDFKTVKSLKAIVTAAPLHVLSNDHETLPSIWQILVPGSHFKVGDT